MGFNDLKGLGVVCFHKCVMAVVKRFAWPQITGIHEHPSSCTLPIITIMQSHPHVGNGPSFTQRK